MGKGRGRKPRGMCRQFPIARCTGWNLEKRLKVESSHVGLNCHTKVLDFFPRSLLRLWDLGSREGRDSLELIIYIPQGCSGEVVRLEGARFSNHCFHDPLALEFI